MIKFDELLPSRLLSLFWLQISRSDFIYSLENDVKPSLGTSDEALDKFIERGMISWGSTKELINRGLMFVKQARWDHVLYLNLIP